MGKYGSGSAFSLRSRKVEVKNTCQKTASTYGVVEQLAVNMGVP